MLKRNVLAALALMIALSVIGHARADVVTGCLTKFGFVVKVKIGDAPLFRCGRFETQITFNTGGGPEPKVVFLSSSRHNGNLGGVAGADAICQTLGNAIDSSRVYRALIAGSAFNSDAYHRFADQTGPYALPNGELVAQSFQQLITGAWIRPVDIDENGTKIVPSELGDSGAWTNTYYYLAYDFNTTSPPPYTSQRSNIASAHCDDWSSGNPLHHGYYGQVNAVNLGQLYYGNQSCSLEMHLYCIED